MNDWEVLGIAPTENETAIRRAYMTELVKHHPEDDLEGFLRLREAYERVIKENIIKAEKEEVTQIEREEELSKVDGWIERVKACYLRHDTRVNPKEWEALLSDEVCYQLDEIEEASNRLLAFLMEHFRLPQKIWKMLDQVFHWEDDCDILYKKFPFGFVNFIRNSISKEDKVDFEEIEVGKGLSSKEVDEWLQHYFHMVEAYEKDDLSTIKVCLESMQSYDIYHPMVDIVWMYYLAHTGKVEEAVKLGRDFLDYHSDYEEGYYVMGRILLEIGQEEEGILMLRQYVKVHPNHYRANMELIKYFVMHPERIMEAKECVQGVSEHGNEDKDEPWMNKAYELLIAYYKEHMDLSIKENKYQLACYYKDIGNLTDCGQLCKAILKDDPKAGEAYYLLSKVYIGTGAYEKALACDSLWLNYAVGAEKKKAYEKRGLLYNYLGDYEKGLEDFNKAIEYAPSDIELHIKKLFILNELERYEELGTCAEHLIDKGHNEGLIYYYLACAKYHLGDLTEALEACRETLCINPYESGAYLIQAKIYSKLGQYAYIYYDIEWVKKYGIEIDDELLYYEVLALMKMGEKEKALVMCEEVVQEGREAEGIYYLYAMLQFEKKQYKDALDALNKSIYLNPTSYKLEARANLYEALRLYDEAVKDYRKQIEMIQKEESKNEKEQIADVYNNIGYVYAEYLNEYQRAVKYFQKAVTINSKCKEAQDNLTRYSQNNIY